MQHNSVKQNYFKALGNALPRGIRQIFICVYPEISLCFLTITRVAKKCQTILGTYPMFVVVVVLYGKNLAI